MLLRGTERELVKRQYCPFPWLTWTVCLHGGACPVTPMLLPCAVKLNPKVRGGLVSSGPQLHISSGSSVCPSASDLLRRQGLCQQGLVLHPVSVTQGVLAPIYGLQHPAHRPRQGLHCIEVLPLPTNSPGAPWKASSYASWGILRILGSPTGLRAPRTHRIGTFVGIVGLGL